MRFGIIGGQPHRLDLVRRDAVKVQDFDTGVPGVIYRTNIAYCGLVQDELLSRPLLGPDPYRMLVSIATENGPELFLDLLIDPRLAKESPEEAVTLEWQGRSRPATQSTPRTANVAQ